eukprot:SM009257S24542  [mRNA]  locus=s9257:2:521:- [translate_table: standard]
MNMLLYVAGQTGAGKTFTMQGPDEDSNNENVDPNVGGTSTPRADERGLIPRVLDYLFSQLSPDNEEMSRSIEYTVKCS